MSDIVREAAARYRNWGKWGPDDEVGTLNYITPDVVADFAEEINLLNPDAGTYTVVVEGYATANPSTFTLFTWALGSTAAGNMTVTAPSSATLGASGTINLTFSGLTAGTKYLGSVAYSGAEGMPNPTIIRIDK